LPSSAPATSSARVFSTSCVSGPNEQVEVASALKIAGHPMAGRFAHLITCLTRPHLSDLRQMPFALCPSACDSAHSLAERRFGLPIDIDLQGELGGWLVMLDLQREQFAHDECFHREIARLSIAARLKHMALHFCKYTGQFATVLQNRESAALRIRTITDSFIISLCSANSLNFDLSKHIAPQLGEGRRFAT
jgi:hypothetical protein